MSYDNRIPLKNGDRIDIVETHSGNDYSVEIKEEIGRGGSCIVYRGVRKNLWIGNELIEDPIYIIKEFEKTEK